MRIKDLLFPVTFIVVLCCSAVSYALDIPLTVKETQGIPRSSEMIHNGVAIARAENFTSTSSLVISDGAVSIPATFEVMARWGGGKDDTSKPIKWLMLSFPASIAGNGSKTFYLRDYGAPASISNSITVTDGPGTIEIDTGVAIFEISETAMTLFDSISINGYVVASGNGGSHTTIDEQSEASANPPTVTIERQNGHYVCMKVVGTYANTAVGTGHEEPMHYRIRYEFFAGSPTAIVTHKFFWPGYDGAIGDDGDITVNNAKLVLPDMVGYSSSDVHATPTLGYTGVAGSTVSVSQDRRALFSGPHQATISNGVTSQTTTFATDPAVICRGANGSLATTIGNMRFFEPQSIEAGTTGKITVNTMAAGHDFADAQGTWARVGIGALPTATDYDDVRALVIAPVEHRLMAIPSASYFSATGVLDMVANPNSTTTEVQDWWSSMGQLAAFSENWYQTKKFHGLMTWGTGVRYPDQIDGISSNSWDKIYQGLDMTDYHNAWLQMTLYGLLSGDVDKITDFAYPAARRMLHTQIFQADDYSGPASGYMGWAPGGYGRYRADFNSSHSYFENLYAYYFLTGDLEAVDLLTVGAEARARLYTRENGSLNDQTSREADWAHYTGRVFYQHASMFDFLGHALNADFLDDWRHMYNHTTSHSMLLLNADGDEYVFFTGDSPTSPVNADQSWMGALYTTEGLYRLWLEYGDIELGSDNLRISRVLAGFARGLWDYTRVAHAQSDGTWGGRWSNITTVAYTGDNIGGTLTNVTHYNETSDPTIYPTGKVNLATAIIRAGVVTNDAALKQHGLDGLTWLTQLDDFQNWDKPIGKESGLTFSRLADGVSYFDNGSPIPVTIPSAPTELTVE